jgi:hypothetical protein
MAPFLVFTHNYKDRFKLEMDSYSITRISFTNTNNPIPLSINFTSLTNNFTSATIHSDINIPEYKFGKLSKR